MASVLGVSPYMAERTWRLEHHVSYKSCIRHTGNNSRMIDGPYVCKLFRTSNHKALCATHSYTTVHNDYTETSARHLKKNTYILYKQRYRQPKSAPVLCTVMYIPHMYWCSGYICNTVYWLVTGTHQLHCISKLFPVARWLLCVLHTYNCPNLPPQVWGMLYPAAVSVGSWWVITCWLLCLAISIGK